MKINKDLTIENKEYSLGSLCDNIDTLKPTILFSGDATENFTLSDSVSNYAEIEIIYGNSQFFRNSMRIKAERIYPALFCYYIDSWGFQLQFTQAFMNRTSFEFVNARYINCTLDTSSCNCGAYTNNIHVYKVVGYK